jgi:hypothetical protein
MTNTTGNTGCGSHEIVVLSPQARVNIAASPVWRARLVPAIVRCERQITNAPPHAPARCLICDTAVRAPKRAHLVLLIPIKPATPGLMGVMCAGCATHPDREVRLREAFDPVWAGAKLVGISTIHPSPKGMQ